MNLNELEKIGKDAAALRDDGVFFAPVAGAFDDAAKSHFQPLIDVAKAAKELVNAMEAVIAQDLLRHLGRQNKALRQQAVGEMVAARGEVDAALKRLEETDA